MGCSDCMEKRGVCPKCGLREDKHVLQYASDIKQTRGFQILVCPRSFWKEYKAPPRSDEEQ